MGAVFLTLDDIFEVQDGIARVIVEKLKGQLTRGSSAVARQLTRSVEAYQEAVALRIVRSWLGDSPVAAKITEMPSRR